MTPEHSTSAEVVHRSGEEGRLEVSSLERPSRSLMTYYVLQSLVLGPFFLFALLPLFFKYRTLRYRFDDEGVSMRWGQLFRREISLNYSRIQDIHLASNFIERWLGLAKVQVQTASGSAGAEMTIEGLEEYEQVRDWLYSRMRGARKRKRDVVDRNAAPPTTTAAENAELVVALREVTAELSAVRTLLERRGPGAGGPSSDPDVRQ